MQALQQTYSYRRAPPESSTRSIFSSLYTTNRGFPGGAVVKNLPENARDAGSIPRSGRCPGEGNGNPLQYSCLKSLMYRGAWQATVHGVTDSQTRFSMPACTHTTDVEKEAWRGEVTCSQQAACWTGPETICLFLPPQPSACWVNPSQACWWAHWDGGRWKRQGL